VGTQTGKSIYRTGVRYFKGEDWGEGGGKSKIEGTTTDPWACGGLGNLGEGGLRSSTKQKYNEKKKM